MKQPVKIILFFLVFFMTRNKVLLSQSIEFRYDASGNRTERNIIALPSSVTETETSTNAAKASLKSTEKGSFSEDIDHNVTITVYPNPTRDDVFVSIQNKDADTHFSLSVYDNTGRLVRTLNDPDEQSGIGLSGFPPGNYFLIIQINGKTSRWRIIKEE